MRCNLDFKGIFIQFLLFFNDQKNKTLATVEPFTAVAIEFTAQPVIPTNGTLFVLVGGGVKQP